MNKILEYIKSNFNDLIKPVVVLLAICIIIPLALSVTNLVTVDRIAELEEANKIAAMKSLVDADKFEDLTYTSDDKAQEFTYNSALKDGKIQAYIFTNSAKGYGGELSVMTAVDANNGTVIAIEVLDVSNETPGLGQNVTRESFYKQLSGKTSGITVVKNGADSEKNEINAVTGASISSRGVATAVNQALDNFALVTAKKDSDKTEVTADEK